MSYCCQGEKMTKRTLIAIEQRILTVMIENAGSHSTRGIAELSGLSWNTAQKYLEQFLKDKWIDHYKSFSHPHAEPQWINNKSSTPGIFTDGL